MEKIIDMLKSLDKEMVELGIALLLQQPLRPAEVNVYLSYYIDPIFYYHWAVNPKKGGPLIILEEFSIINQMSKNLKSIKVVDYDRKTTNDAGE